jgi:hypothetical protein
MRPTCYSCARKHLAQADILMMEAAMGYPIHAWYAMGHMSEAADELIDECPQYAEVIREQRKLYEESIVLIEDAEAAGEVPEPPLSVDVVGMIADLTLIANGVATEEVLASAKDDSEADPGAETRKLDASELPGE